VSSRVRERLGASLALEQILDGSVASLARAIESGGPAADAPRLPPVKPASREAWAPLSYPHEAGWLLGQLDPESLAYQCPSLLHLDGPLDQAALARSLEEIVRRHEILRTTVVETDDGPRQQIHPPWKVDLGPVDLSGAPDPRIELER